MKKDFNPIYSENIYSKCFFRTAEVVNHTKRNDFWVILNQRVIELSDLMKTIDHIEDDEKNLAALHQMEMFGGTDLTELFNERATRHLELFDLKSQSDYGRANDLFWWNDPACIIGSITIRERHVSIHNKQKGTQLHLAVCEEDSIYEIRKKFVAAYPDEKNENSVWRKTESTCCPGGHLFLDKTLAENKLQWNAKDEAVSLWVFHRDDANTCADFL